MAVGLKSPENLLSVKGIQLATVTSAMRYVGRDDILLMVFDDNANTAAIFTKNRYCAAPVVVAKRHVAKNSVKALLINAGNANAGTGKQGELDAIACCQQLADKLDCQVEQILPFSTGVIGMALPMGKFSSGIQNAVEQLGEADWYAAASSIMTTDTVAKAFSEQLEINGQVITVTGIAKGSGMICPDMATMLSYIVTDANVSLPLLQSMISDVAAQSFNRITVDGDTSTNDALTLTATGTAGNREFTHEDTHEIKQLTAVINSIAIKLAQAVIRDGEGATKFVEINVIGGRTQADCDVVAYTVAHSPLVKTALFANDPNWGRILAAVGRAPIDHLDIAMVDLSVNGVVIIEAGEPAASYSEDRGQQVFAKEDIVIEIHIGPSQEYSCIWTNDLSYEYVRINADYRS